MADGARHEQHHPPRFRLEALRDATVLDATRCIGGGFGASILARMGLRVLRPRSGEDLIPGVSPGSSLAALIRRGVHLLDEDSNLSVIERIERLSPNVLLISGNGAGHDDAEIKALKKIDGLVIVSLSPLGLSPALADDVADTPLTLAARSGWLAITGEQDSPPVIIRGHVGEFASGWAVASAAIMGLSKRARSGEGSFSDVSSVEVFAFLQWMSTQRAAFGGGIMQRTGSRAIGHPWGVYPCSDGYVVLIVGGSRRNWERFADLLDAPVLKEPKFATPAGRAQYADEIDAHMMPWLFSHTAEEIYALGQGVGLPFGVVRHPADLPRDAQLVARRFFAQEEDGRLYPELPITIDGRRVASSDWSVG